MLIILTLLSLIAINLQCNNVLQHNEMWSVLGKQREVY